MKKLIITGKTVDDALKNALIELGLDQKEVEYTVLEEEQKGFLGLIGNKEAKIEVREKFNAEKVLANFLKELTSLMNINCEFDIEEEEKCYKVNFDASSENDKGILIGKRGQTLDAVQFLAQTYINKFSDEFIRVSMDVGNYRERRESTLKALAYKTAEKAKKYKKPMKLEPMNAYERRVIHYALHDITGVSTYSEGEEPFRRVVIIAK